MQKLTTLRGAVVIAFAVLAAALLSDGQNAEARPQYMKEFNSTYPKVEEAKTAKCGVCHGKTKKERNAYGTAVGEGLTAKNEKDAEAIAKALKAAEEKKGDDGKTFGEQLGAGELPK